jgi:hypothetical protein
VSQDSSRRLALTTFVFVALLTACGSSSVASTPSATPLAIPTPTVTPAPPACPTAARVGSALGITLTRLTGVPAVNEGTPLPAGAKFIACEYPATTFNVIIVVLTNISPTYISQFSSKFPVAYATVTGVGDQARSFIAPLGSGKDNEGVVATKGSTLVAITATDTPASLEQLEALVNQLL